MATEYVLDVTAADNDMNRIKGAPYDPDVPPPQPATFKVIAPW